MQEIRAETGQQSICFSDRKRRKSSEKSKNREVRIAFYNF